MSNYSVYGYPDPVSLDKVVAEMAAQGVEEGIVRGRNLVVVMMTYITYRKCSC